MRGTLNYRPQNSFANAQRIGYQLIIMVFFSMFLTSCSKNDESLKLPSVTPPAKVTPPTPIKKEEFAKYVYPHATQRDLFIPLVGSAASGSGNMGSVIDRRGEFVSLELRGIMRDKRGKVAMISTSDGQTYFLKAGKIYDKRNRIISGVSGIIKENSVVLISQNKTMKELHLVKKEKTQ